MATGRLAVSALPRNSEYQGASPTVPSNHILRAAQDYLQRASPDPTVLPRRLRNTPRGKVPGATRTPTSSALPAENRVPLAAEYPQLSALAA